MRSVPWITLYVGLAIGGGYLVGAALRWRLWAAAWPRPASSVDREEGGIGDERGRIDPVVAVALIEAAAAVVWSLLVLWAIDRVAPGAATFRDSSAVGFLSSQTLTAWESASLWSGIAVIVGLTFPSPLAVDRGSSGVAGVIALLFLYLPVALFVAASAFFGAQLVQGKQRWSPTIAIVMLPTSEWVASIFQLRASWGFVHGPETALWMLAVAGVLAARRGRTAWEQFGPL